MNENERDPDLLRKRILILIVAYNAESTIQQVLRRIPKPVFDYDYEILILDDQSADHTFSQSIKYQQKHDNLNLKILYNPKNQGYGGNQKLGYQYAIDNNFDAVALLHGDGQYAPEIIEDLFLPVLKGEAEAVFGSRMVEKGKALKGGMPFYKYLGNRILSGFQNRLLGLGLSEYHSGYRVYAVEALKKIHYQYNTSDFHFDTEIIIQLWLLGARIKEIPIPTYYGDEICRVNGILYAWNVFKATLGVRMQQMQLCYQRKYDIEREGERYPLKLGYESSHTKALAAIYSGAKVLDIGCGEGYFGLELQKKDCDVWGIDDACLDLECKLEKYEKADLNDGKLPFNPGDFDFVLMLDILEHLNTISIYQILDNIRERTGHGRTRIIISTANISFIIVRLQLLFGNFNYGKRGILDYTHRHLFTRSSLINILEQCGFIVHKTEGISAPFPAAVGDNWLSRILLAVSRAGIAVWPELFSYQFFIEATSLPTSNDLLRDAESAADSMQRKDQTDEE
ncbi:MAG: glycosyltransferase [Planctomycetota bacterium]